MMQQVYTQQYGELAEREDVFERLIGIYGHPDPFLWHDGGRTGSSKFAAMLLHIVSQSISAAGSFAIYDKIASATGRTPTAASIINLGAQALRETGMSGNKVEYVLNLAHAQADGVFDIEAMDRLGDRQIIELLTCIRGIGLWSAQAFLLRQMHRPDVLPPGDNGIQRAVQAAWQLEKLPTAPQTRRVAAPWAPYRSFAAALLWVSLAPPGEPSDPKARALAREADRA